MSIKVYQLLLSEIFNYMHWVINSSKIALHGVVNIHSACKFGKFSRVLHVVDLAVQMCKITSVVFEFMNRIILKKQLRKASKYDEGRKIIVVSYALILYFVAVMT